MSRPGPTRTRSLRPAKPPIDPGRPLGHRWDVERGVRVESRRVLTVFLAGAECPFTCLFCDLWKHTLEGPTPRGALPTQLEIALEEASPDGSAAAGQDAIKLYNASNFFDPRAVPPDDAEALARLCSGFARVTVETHPRLVDERTAELSAALDGRLEIAIGLETVHPEVFPRLDKGMELTHFEAAVAFARDRDIGVRAFVLVGLPWVPPGEFAPWAVKTTSFAASLGVDRVSLIPLRRGNGALDELAARGELLSVRLHHLEEAMEAALAVAGGDMIVDTDLWDVGLLGACDLCLEPRTGRLRAANLSQQLAPPQACECGA